MALGELANFIAYILPGFVALQIVRSRLPASQLSGFAQTAYSILFGVAVSVVLSRLGLLSTCFATGSIPSVRDLLALLGGGVLAGYLIVLLRYLRTAIGQKWKWIRPSERTVWNEINRSGRADEWMIVYLSDGSIYRGVATSVRVDIDADDPDFRLENADRIDDNHELLYHVVGEGVYIRTGNVVRIELWEGE